MTTKKTIAWEEGVKDALNFISENDTETLKSCLEPGQEKADYALINALGPSKVAALFGVDLDSDAYREACSEYSEAFDDTIRLTLLRES